MLLAERTHPGVHWVPGQRYVDSGQFISSAGVTSGIDATLYTLGRMFGRETADRTAAAMGYPHTRFLDDPTSTIQLRDDTSVWPNFYRWDRSDIGLLLYEGVREVDVASVVDTYPRSLGATVHTLAAQRTIVRTRHGLDLVPRNTFSTAPALDRVLVPGSGLTPAAEAVAQTWAAPHAGPVVESIHAGAGYPYDATFRDLARSQSNGVASAVANVLEYPTVQLQFEGPVVQLNLLLRPLLLGLLGLGATAWLRRRGSRPGPLLTPRLRRAALSGGRFALHFAEMSIAMGVGMMAFHLPIGGQSYQAAAATASAAFQVTSELGMMVFMTVPMVAWMRVRSHSWRHGADMAAGMLAQVIVVDLLLAADTASVVPWLQYAVGPSMMLGMLAAMLLRREHYLGTQAHTAAPLREIMTAV